MEGAARAERGSDVSPAAAGDRWSGETGRHWGEQGAVQAVCTEGVTLGLPLRVLGIEETTVGKNTIRRPDEAAMSRLLAEQKKTAAGLILRLARTALDQAGLGGISLMDLRHDFIIRQLEQHDWPYVARISGIAVNTLYACFSGYLPEGRRKTAGRRTEVDAFLLWKLLQTEGSSPVGLALWMSWKLGMQAREIVALTWSQVDLDRGVIHLPDRDLTLGITLRRLLRTAQNRRREGDDPHVLLAPNSRRPIDQPRLSKLVRTALIRGGLETVSLGDLCREERREGEDARLLVYAAETGAISRSEAMSILGLSKVAAYERLRQLTASGRLVRVGTKYYPAGQVVPPEEQYGVIREFLTQSGPAYRQDLAALLHIGDRQCALILKHMVEAGRLVRTGQRYALPVEEKAIL